MSKARGWVSIGLVFAVTSGCSNKEEISIEYPASQQAFHALNWQCRQAYAAGKNEIQKSLAFNRCNQDRAKFAQTNELQGWVGEISDISTDQGADFVSVTISTSIDGFDISYGTLSNRISDSGIDSLITPSSPLFGVLAQLKEGDTVAFDANLLFHPEGKRGLWEGSVSEQGSMNEPEFNVRIISIKPYGSSRAVESVMVMERETDHLGANRALAAQSEAASARAKGNDPALEAAMEAADRAVSASDHARDVKDEAQTFEDSAKPSFECARATSKTEIEICANTTLARVDVYTAAMYRCLSKRSPEGMDVLRAEQRAWLPKRDACENDVGCIRGAYGEIARIYMVSPAFEDCQTLVVGDDT